MDNIKPHLLIIDDDDRIRELLKNYLSKNDFFITLASNTREAEEKISKYIFDILIVDLMMPDESGIDFLKRIRSGNNSTPAIMLTAMSDIDNKSNCFENGCNDYLTKPFEPKELILRINNILKQKPSKNTFCKFGNYIFDFNKQKLIKENEEIYLTSVEIKLLEILCKNINSPIARSDLLFDDLNERSIDVLVARLRKKIEENPKNPSFLKTVRNIGYSLIG